MSKFIIVFFVVGFAACAFADSDDDDDNSGGLLGGIFPGFGNLFGDFGHKSAFGKGSLFDNDMEKPIEDMTDIPKNAKFEGHEHKTSHSEKWVNGKKVVDEGSEKSVDNDNGDVKVSTSSY